MTGWPTLTVECAFGTVPSSLTPAWTDITAYVLQVAGLTWGTRGRPDRFTQTQPNQLGLTLLNSDGRFTAGLASSPYWPNVKVGRRIRVSETYNGVTYRRFDGYVVEWPTAWTSGVAYSEVKITATDRFGKFGRARKLRSVLQEEVLGDGPVAYWPLGEPYGSQIAADVSGPATNLKVTQVGSGGTLTFGSGVGPPTETLPALVVAPVDTDSGLYLLTGAVPGAVVAGVCTVECWFIAPPGVPSATTPMGVVFDDRRTYLQAYFVTAGGLSLTSTVYNSALTPFTAQVGTSAVMADGLLHHMVGVLTVTTVSVKVTLYVDGVLVGSQTTAATGTAILPTSITQVAVGAFPSRYGLASAFGLHRGTLAHAAVYGNALTPAQSLAHNLAGRTGFAGEKSNVRVTRLARYSGVDSSQLTLDSGASGIAAQTFLDGDVLGLMQEAADAEDGPLFMSGDGKLTLHSRTRRYSLTPAFTLHASDVGVETTFVTDPQFLVNDASYARTNGAEQRSVNAASIADYDPYADQRTFALTTDGEVRDRADWRVNVLSTPAARCSQVRVNLLAQSSTSQVAAVLAAEVSTRFTLNQLPAQAPATSVDLVIEGVSETLSDKEWSVTFNTSPASTLTNVWTFDTVTTEPMTFGY